MYFIDGSYVFRFFWFFGFARFGLDGNIMWLIKEYPNHFLDVVNISLLLEEEEGMHETKWNMFQIRKIDILI